MTATIPTSEHGVREATSSEIFAALPADVLNTLGTQRDNIVSAISQAEDLVELRAAERMLWLVEGVWHALGYGYKGAEMRQRIKHRGCVLASQYRDAARGTPARQHAARRKSINAADALDAYAGQF